MRRIIGPKREENGEWKSFQNNELHCLHISPNVVRVIKFKSLKCEDHVAGMEEGRSVFKILKVNL
jgi:hypothetical protein